CRRSAATPGGRTACSAARSRPTAGTTRIEWRPPAAPPRASPDAHALRRRQVQVLARLRIERLVPAVDVAHGLRAPAAGRVNATHHLPAQRLVTRLVAPGLGEGDEEALLAAEALQLRRRLAAERVEVGLVRDLEAGEVGDVLAQRLLAVDVQARQRLVGVVLRRQLAPGLLEVGHVLLAPPVLELALGVEVGTEVVEAVHDLVPDHRTDRAVVG